MTPSDEELRDKGDYLAVRSRQDSCSCTDLAKEITRALAFVRNQSFNAGEESGIRKAEGLAMQFVLGAYSSDTEAACENLRQAILSLLPPSEGTEEK